MTNFRFSPRPNRAHEIHWRDWNDDAFAEAKRDDKLILLDISGVWCHWCHCSNTQNGHSDARLVLPLHREKSDTARASSQLPASDEVPFAQIK